VNENEKENPEAARVAQKMVGNPNDISVL